MVRQKIVHRDSKDPAVEREGLGAVLRRWKRRIRGWRSGLATGTLLVGLVLAGTPGEGAYSRLWGEGGAGWNSDSRLPDFSFAGFERGEAPLPEFEDAVVHNVRDFGAVGDGETDDTEAFQSAIRAAENEDGPAVVRVPGGEYVITGFLDIRRSRVVLRGEGPGDTTLFFPRTLTDVEPNWGATTGGRRTSNYSWSGGFLRIRGGDSGRPVSRVAEQAARGARSLTLAESGNLAPEDTVRLLMEDDDAQSLAHVLYAGEPGPIENLRGHIRTSQVFRVTGVDGNRVELDRPLRFEVREEWNPRLHTFEPAVTHSGIEGMTLKFPGGDYEGHFTELGYNGIAIDGGVAHAWVRDVHMRNPESGIFVSGRFCTVRGIRIDSERSPSDRNHVGHHAITLGGEDNLLEDFAIDGRYIHDITVSRGSFGNVLAGGRATDLNLDHHRRAPYENLFTDLDAGAGTRLWASGGGAGLGRHAAARNTYWNIRSTNPIAMPPDRFAPPQINIVGVNMDTAPVMEEEGRWIEPIDPEQLRPRNLYEAQLRHRLNADE